MLAMRTVRRRVACTAYVICLGVSLAGAAMVTGTASASLATVTIEIGPDGPTPAVAHLTAGLAAPSWINTTDAPRSIAFANGLCSMSVPAGSRVTCEHSFWRFVGEYRYTVDGIQGTLMVDPAARRVTLRASVQRIRPRQSLMLSGSLSYAVYLGLQAPQPLLVLARRAGSDHYVRVAHVTPRSVDETLVWRLAVRPSLATTYLVEARWQPQQGAVWQIARSRPLRVGVQR
jgi:hypothetical protein